MSLASPGQPGANHPCPGGAMPGGLLSLRNRAPVRLSGFGLAPVRCQRRHVRGRPVGHIYGKPVRRAARLLTPGSPSGLEALSVRVFVIILYHPVYSILLLPLHSFPRHSLCVFYNEDFYLSVVIDPSGRHFCRAFAFQGWCEHAESPFGPAFRPRTRDAQRGGACGGIPHARDAQA